MRYLFAAVCVLVLLIGSLFGALNPQPVTIDFYLYAFELRLGVALLAAVLFGALLGGLCAALALGLQGRRRRRVDVRTDAAGSSMSTVDESTE